VGVRLGGVVNRERHVAALSDHSPQVQSVSKFPPAFSIDLLIDDLPGVALEGQRHGFDVLVVDPNDADWTEQVGTAVKSRMPSNPALQTDGASPRR